MKNVVVVQAREGSSRLPNKVLKKIKNRTILENVVDKCLNLNNVSKIIVATTTNSYKIKDICIENNYEYLEGSETNVLERFTDVIKKYKIDNLIRINSDCPLFDYSITQFTIDKYLKHYPNFDYASNTITKSFPQGFDVEIINANILTNLNDQSLEKEDYEHVTLYIRKNANLYKAISILNNEDYGKYRLTIDTKSDFEILKWISNHYEDINDIKFDAKLKKILMSSKYQEFNKLFESDSLVNKYSKNKFLELLEYKY